MTVKRILILEDEKMWADNIKSAIEEYKTELSIEIDWVEDCMAGMKKLINSDYDLLISDVQINDKPKGLCLIWACRNLKRSIPVLIVSGFITREQVLESLQDYSISPNDIFLKNHIDIKKFRTRVFKKLERETPKKSEVAVTIDETTGQNKDMLDKMKWILFWVFILLFVVIVAGTLGMLFFDFGDQTPEERSLLVNVFIVEIGLCVPALFYSVFNIKK